MKRKKGKVKKKVIIIISICFVIILLSGLGFVLYQNIHGVSSKLKLKLLGKENTYLVNEEYKDDGVKATYEGKNLASKVKVTGTVNTKKIGTYKLKYTVKYKKISKTITRKVQVVDKTPPEITLENKEVYLTVGNDYQEPGYKAIDNYDNDITSSVKVNSNINKDQVGKYQVTYTVFDSSNNKAEATRDVYVVEKPKTDQKIAVLNYHFFYDSSKGEVCNEDICEEISQFKSHLKWFNDNGYKTLTMSEFRDWMYGKIELPEKSVLLTVDDGAMGTGRHNGYTLIPALEEYKAHATLFLITGWWDISNYQGSEYLEIESHTNDMHNEGFCSGVTRGARMLCQDYDTVKNDLLKSIEITNSKKAFCFPFYAYDEKSINAVKEVGFELAFVGGSRKASRNDNKYTIPRYPISRRHQLEDIIAMVS